MPAALVLINTETGSMGSVLKKLENIDGIEEAYSVYGVYDIVAKIEAETMEKLKDLVTYRIRRLDNVRTTLTMIIIKKV